MKKALFIQGGWEPHQPAEFCRILADGLAPHGIETEISDTQDSLLDRDLSDYDLISINWTMGEMSEDATKTLSSIVREGVGFAGIHGGAGDAFRGNLDFEWMVGGHFVGHPHVGPYKVNVTQGDHVIMQGMPESFDYNSEQYYMMTDPAINVLADCVYERPEGEVTMPAVWTRQWGQGRVFYSALGHHPKEYTDFPLALELALKGFVWAAR